MDENLPETRDLVEWAKSPAQEFAVVLCAYAILPTMVGEHPPQRMRGTARFARLCPPYELVSS
jgi:hypothetical protein